MVFLTPTGPHGVDEFPKKGVVITIGLRCPSMHLDLLVACHEQVKRLHPQVGKPFCASNGAEGSRQRQDRHEDFQSDNYGFSKSLMLL